jgi:hypothetical protein
MSVGNYALHDESGDSGKINIGSAAATSVLSPPAVVAISKTTRAAMVGSRRRQRYHKRTRLTDSHIFDGIPVLGMTPAKSE